MAPPLHAPKPPWMRPRLRRTTSSPLLQAIRPKDDPRRRIDRLWSVLWHTIIEFRGDNIPLRSAALTYITLFSLVPTVAVAFAIVNAIGQDEIRQALHEFIFTNLVPGTAQQLSEYLDTFITRASSGALGALGGFFLLVSVVSLLNNIEISLNEIWGVQRRRSPLQQGLIYWCVITLGPVIMGVSILAAGAMRARIEQYIYIPRSLYTLVPMVITILFFLFLYIATPNARVRTVPALIGATIAGVVWEIAKHAYAIYTVKSISYSAIYGSLGAIPLFLLWIYLNWFIFLTGARIGFALQHAVTGTPSDPRISDGRARELLYVRLMLKVCSAFLGGRPAPQPKALASELEIDVAYVAEAARTLIDKGLLAEGAGGGYVPSRPPSKITVADVVRAAGARPELPDSGGSVPSDSLSPILQLFSDSDRQSLTPLERMTLGKLGSEVASAEPPGASP